MHNDIDAGSSAPTALHSNETPATPRLSRRSATIGAAWGTAAIATASPAPALAASALPLVNPYAGTALYWSVSNLNGSRQWTSSSAMTFGIAENTLPTRWKWNISSNTAGLTADLLTFWCDVETPWQVTWNPMPTGWAMALQASGGGFWTYRLTLTAAPQTFAVGTPLANTAATGLALPPNLVTGTVSNAAATANGWIANGDFWDDQSSIFDVSYGWSFTVHYPAPWSTSATSAGGRSTQFQLPN